MSKINIRESLRRMDEDTFCKYDLLTMYDSCPLTDDDKKGIAKLLYDKEDPEVIYQKLSMYFDDDQIADIDTFADTLVTGKYESLIENCVKKLSEDYNDVHYNSTANQLEFDDRVNSYSVGVSPFDDVDTEDYELFIDYDYECPHCFSTEQDAIDFVIDYIKNKVNNIDDSEVVNCDDCMTYKVYDIVEDEDRLTAKCMNESTNDFEDIKLGKINSQKVNELINNMLNNPNYKVTEEVKQKIFKNSAPWGLAVQMTPSVDVDGTNGLLATGDFGGEASFGESIETNFEKDDRVTDGAREGTVIDYDSQKVLVEWDYSDTDDIEWIDKSTLELVNEINSGFLPNMNYCPACGGTRFNVKTGVCIDCGYDEGDWGYTGTDDDFDDDFYKSFELKESSNLDYNPKDGWTDDDIKLHQSINWEDRDYMDFPVNEDSFTGAVVLYGNDKHELKNVKMIKYLIANPLYPPYYAPKENPFKQYSNIVGPMYDGRKHNSYQIHDRYETQELYDTIFESAVNNDKSKINKKLQKNESKSTNESSDSEYWYFTKHGVQPGSIPNNIDVLEIKDTPNGTYFKGNRVLTTKELQDYEIKEKSPEMKESKSLNEDNKEQSEIDKKVRNFASRYDLLWSISSLLRYEDWYDDDVEFHVERHKDGSNWICPEHPLGDKDARRVTGYIEDILVDRYDMNPQDFKVIEDKYSEWTILFKESKSLNEGLKEEFKKQLQDELYDKFIDLARTPEWGFDSIAEIDAFLMPVIEVKDYKGEYDNDFVAEVRGEFSYDELEDVGDILNPIVQKYDKEAYFEPVTGGITRAYIKLDDDKEDAETELQFIDRRKGSIIRGDDDYGFDEYDLVNESVHQIAKTSFTERYDRDRDYLRFISRLKKANTSEEVREISNDIDNYGVATEDESDYISLQHSVMNRLKELEMNESKGPNANKLKELIDDGVVSKDFIVNEFINYLSEEDIQDFLSEYDLVNELSEDVENDISGRYDEASEHLMDLIYDEVSAEVVDYYIDNFGSSFIITYSNNLDNIRNEAINLSAVLTKNGYKVRDWDTNGNNVVILRFAKPVSLNEGIENDDELISAEQEFDSAATSINSNKLPAVYSMVRFNPGDVVVDFGGGKFDNAVNYLKDQDVTLLVYDPYNRSAQHNKEVLKVLREHGGADAAVNSNVLNVIKEPEVRNAVLQNIKKITKKGAPIYITVYEGTGKGNEGPTKSGYQLNRKTVNYMDEIGHVFSNVKRKGKLITAINEALNEATKGPGIKITGGSCDTKWIYDTMETPISMYFVINNIPCEFKFSPNHGQYVVNGVDCNHVLFEGDRFYKDLTHSGGTARSYALNIPGNVLTSQPKQNQKDYRFTGHYYSTVPAIKYCKELLKELFTQHPDYFYDNILDKLGIAQPLEEANYGGAFDVEDDHYFTREDIIDFGNKVCEILGEIYPDTFDISDTYIHDNNILFLEVTSKQGNEGSANFKIDMRKIKKPSDLLKFTDEMAFYLRQDLEELYTDNSIFTESASDWRYVASKSVPDSDGFLTDYIWYENTKDGRHVFIFGDNDLYDDVDSNYADWETDSYSEAKSWFDNYHGFDEEDM